MKTQTTKQVSFSCPDQAVIVYEQSVQILNDMKQDGKKLVTITGKIVTVPAWFPMPVSVN